MSFKGLKHYLPRSLYGRAAMIMVIPVLVLQLVVSVAFIQNHLEDTITQMTGTVVRELRLIEAQAGDAASHEEVLERIAPLLPALQMNVEFIEPVSVPGSDLILWYDFSGGLVRNLIRESFPATLAVQFPADNSVHLFFGTDLGPAHVSFGRSRVTVAAPHQLIVTMVFFGMLMTIIAFLYLRNQLRPVTRLANAAQAFGRGRNVPYSPSGAIEIRAAGSAFLDMRARIERQIEQRTMMLSGVSHDLRTPLTRLKLGLAMLDEEDAAPLLGDVNEMQRLLDAFLDFSRGAASAGEPEKVDPKELVRTIVEDAQREGKQVELVEASGEGLIALRPLAMRRAVENLLSNAVRYGTRAEVSVVLTDKSLRIRVEDDGPGIPSDLRGEALKPFSRLDPSRNQNQGSGVGLGLAIVSDIARAHGGVLRLDDSDTMGGLRADLVIGR
ncbi:ATP-binding protein [Phaeobacter marinintestinus]|uniref:ATP-binding protein n=1 Tax=Falsiphaeobacter marinintestinus TaxID=1492905 RepID=UPI0011B656B2|nr:ATP-binding protein [Phaeobacter marinintestinus]